MPNRDRDGELAELRAQLAQLAEEGRRLTRIAEELYARIAPPGTLRHRKPGGHLRLVKGVLVGAGVTTCWRLLRSGAAGAIAGGLAAATVTAVTVPLVISSPPPPHPRRGRLPVSVQVPARGAGLAQRDIDPPVAYHVSVPPGRTHSPAPSPSSSSCVVQGVVVLPSCPAPSMPASASASPSPSPSPTPSPSETGDGKGKGNGQGQQQCDVPLIGLCLSTGLTL